MTITMDEKLYRRLKRELPARDTSAFINAAVRARLYPDKRTLDEAYKKAPRERRRHQVSEDWKNTTGEEWPE